MKFSPCRAAPVVVSRAVGTATTESITCSMTMDFFAAFSARAGHGEPSDQERDAGVAAEGREVGASSDLLASMVDAIEYSSELRREDGAHAVEAPNIDPVDESVRPTDPRVARRVEHLFRLGHRQRAMRALVSTTGMADLDEADERATLDELHPIGPPALPVCQATPRS